MRFFPGALFCLIAAEVLLRSVFGFCHPVLYQFDADCGYLPKPNQHVRRFFCANDINEFGMRSPPVQTPKPKDELRVLFVGDSVLFGMTHVDQSKICTSILQRELPGQLHRPVEVLNASAGGWGVPNEVGFIHSRGTFNADLVVFVLNTYDIIQPFDDVIPGKAVTMPVKNPPLALGEVWWRYLEPRIFGIPAADRGSSSPVVPDQNAAIASTLQWLQNAKRQCDSAGARFAIVYSPVVGTDYRPSAQLFPLRQKLVDWSKSANVPLLDLSEEDSRHPGREVYFDTIHRSAKGQQSMARAIEQWSLITSQDKS